MKSFSYQIGMNFMQERVAFMKNSSTFPSSYLLCLAIYLSIYLSINLSIEVPLYLFVDITYLPLYLSILLFIYLSIHLPTYLEPMQGIK